jgi:hypothetical protein
LVHQVKDFVINCVILFLTISPVLFIIHKETVKQSLHHDGEVRSLNDIDEDEVNDVELEDTDQLGL